MKINKLALLTPLLFLIIQGCTTNKSPDQVATGIAGTLTALPPPTLYALSSPTSSTSTPPVKAEPSNPKTMQTPFIASGPTQSPNLQPSPVSDQAGIAPYPNAPLCPDTGDAHDHSLFHTLWDSVRGCHYDHEHGQNPFTQEVATTFPGFDLLALIGGVGVGHTNPSSEVENTHKHGVYKWDVTLSHSAGCVGGDGATYGVDAAVIQYHSFGDYSIELEARFHSAMALMRQCLESNPGDYGYVFINQLEDYGQRVTPYQGTVLQYPFTPLPEYDSSLKPYFTVECIGGVPPCEKYPDYQSFLDQKNTADSLWVSEPLHLADSGSPLFALLFKTRDIYQVLDWTDQEYPFTFLWLCSADGGQTYDPAGCRFNNTTTRVQQVAGTIPASWDNLPGFDTDMRAGRITAEGYVTRFGELTMDCTTPDTDCHPIKLVQAFVGSYGSLFFDKEETSSPIGTPERDIYFCGDQVCSEDSPGAVPSGWVGQEN
jgi:hypothetical protein